MFAQNCTCDLKIVFLNDQWKFNTYGRKIFGNIFSKIVFVYLIGRLMVNGIDAVFIHLGDGHAFPYRNPVETVVYMDLKVGVVQCCSDCTIGSDFIAGKDIGFAKLCLISCHTAGNNDIIFCRRDATDIVFTV